MQKTFGDIFTWIRHPVPRTLTLMFIAGATLGLVSLYATAELGRLLVLLLGFPCVLAMTNASVMQKLRKKKWAAFVSMALTQAVITATLQLSGFAPALHLPGAQDPTTHQTDSVFAGLNP